MLSMYEFLNELCKLPSTPSSLLSSPLLATEAGETLVGEEGYHQVMGHLGIKFNTSGFDTECNIE